MSEPRLRTPRIRLIEPHLTAHGPLWLDYLVSAFAPRCDEIAVFHPDEPTYEILDAARAGWAQRGRARITLKPERVPAGKGRLPVEWTLDRASQPGADLSLITFVDQTVWGRHRPSAVVGGVRPEIWGIWFWVVDPRGRARRLARRLFDPHAQWEARCLRAQRRPPAWLDGIFFDDDRAPERVMFDGPSRVLPDPRRTWSREDSQVLRRRLGLPQDAVLFLHIGSDHDRKGLGDAIAAFEHAPAGAVLMRAGPVAPERRDAMRDLVERGRAVHVDAWIPEGDLDAIFRAVDWMLLPYRDHEFSSGLLSAAATAQRPIIASDHGLIGRRMRAFAMGHLYPNGSRAGLADAIRRAASEDISKYRSALDAYAATQSMAKFEATLLAPFLSRDGIPGAAGPHPLPRPPPAMESA